MSVGTLTKTYTYTFRQLTYILESKAMNLLSVQMMKMVQMMKLSQMIKLMFCQNVAESEASNKLEIVRGTLLKL